MPIERILFLAVVAFGIYAMVEYGRAVFKRNQTRQEHRHNTSAAMASVSVSQPSID